MGPKYGPLGRLGGSVGTLKGTCRVYSRYTRIPGLGAQVILGTQPKTLNPKPPMVSTLDSPEMTSHRGPAKPKPSAPMKKTFPKLTDKGCSLGFITIAYKVWGRIVGFEIVLIQHIWES